MLKPLRCQFNILVTDAGDALITDFGISRMVSDAEFRSIESTVDPKYSICWASPEAVNGTDPLTLASDIWGFAWVCFEVMSAPNPLETTLSFLTQIITEELPFRDSKSVGNVVLRICTGNLPSASQYNLASSFLDVWNLMEQCWAMTPLERPSSRTCESMIEKLVCACRY